LSWSQRRTRRILGHHDGVHEAIVISRSLDRGDIPEFRVRALSRDASRKASSAHHVDGASTTLPPSGLKSVALNHDRP
jgi:hypothetical protein